MHLGHSTLFVVGMACVLLLATWFFAKRFRKIAIFLAFPLIGLSVWGAWYFLFPQFGSLALHQRMAFLRGVIVVLTPGAMGVCSAFAFIRGPLRRYRRRRRGECIGCGYNLTGNESGMCPECGETTEPA